MSHNHRWIPAHVSHNHSWLPAHRCHTITAEYLHRCHKITAEHLHTGLYGLFVPRTTRTQDYSYYGWTIRTLDNLYDGLFAHWTIRTMDFRTTDYSYCGLFVPSVKYSHNINCWCEGVPPDAHPTGCLSNASRPRRKTSYLYVQLCHVGYFLVITAKPTFCCLLFHIF